MYMTCEWQLWAEIAVIAPVRNMAVVWRAIGTRVDIVAVVSDERIVAPADTSVIEEHILAFAAMIAAVH